MFRFQRAEFSKTVQAKSTEGLDQEKDRVGKTQRRARVIGQSVLGYRFTLAGLRNYDAYEFAVTVENGKSFRRG